MYIVATLTFDICRGKSVKRRWGSHPLIMIVPCIQIVRWKCMFTAPKLRDIPSMPYYPQKSAGCTSELWLFLASKLWGGNACSQLPNYVIYQVCRITHRTLRVVLLNIWVAGFVAHYYRSINQGNDEGAPFQTCQDMY
jgi:hypothetical protein